jgi:small subunit ribosomal protein S17
VSPGGEELAMAQEAQGAKRGNRKVRTGEVVKSGADKTVVVAIRRRVQHPLYHKIVNRTSKIMAHDEKNECSVGDVVRVMETRPLSKRKRWRYIETVRKAK